MRLRRVKMAFDDPEYIFELKHDGFRTVAYIENRECRLLSRNLKYLQFESLRESLAKLSVRDAIMDGEVICLDTNGVSRFSYLLGKKWEPVLYAFDLLWLNGEDLRKLPLVGRKDRLRRLIDSSECSRILYAQHIEGRGKEFFKEVCERDLEGIVAKHKLGIYKDDEIGWLKIKNPKYSQAEGRHELLTRRK